MPEARTEKLYLGDAYTAAFQATVASAAPLDTPTAVAVVLDRSYFYPESGGQLPDRGRIGSLAVTDVQEDGEVVVHHAALDPGAAAPVAGETLACAIDWDRRFDHMQQHTGQHVISRAFIATGDLHTVSFHMGEDTCTIDLDGAHLDERAAADAEALANRVVEENRSVTVRTVPLEALETMDLRRSVPDGVTEARLVEVDGFDAIPCCGTHVRSTGELGLVKVLRWEKARGFWRVHFKVGRRALADYAEKHDICQELTHRFTTGTSEILAKVDKLTAENQSQRRTLKSMGERLAGVEAADLVSSAVRHGEMAVATGVVDGDGGFARAVATAAVAGGKTVAIVGSGDGTVVCASSRGLAVDVASSAVARAQAAGGSGGGKGGFAQVKLPAGSSVEAFVKEVAHAIVES